MALTSEAKEAILRRDEHGNILIRSNCKRCKQCWIYLDSKLAGTCIYGGPFEGNELQEDTRHFEASKEDKVPEVCLGG